MTNFLKQSNTRKVVEYQPLRNSLITKGCKVGPLMVVIVSARATTHIPSTKCLELRLKILVTKIENALHILQNHHTICTLYYTCP